MAAVPLRPQHADVAGLAQLAAEGRIEYGPAVGTPRGIAVRQVLGQKRAHFFARCPRIGRRRKWVNGENRQGAVLGKIEGHRQTVRGRFDDLGVDDAARNIPEILLADMHTVIGKAT